MTSLLRRIGQATLFGTGAFVAYDTAFEDARVMRNVRMIHAALLTLVDYKYYFNAENASEVHQRVASRLLDVFRKNGGLYVKFGQGIASMNHVLPPEFRKTLAVLQDQAPVVDMEAVDKIFMEEFGKSPYELYDEFDPTPIASASIAQVHKAKLKGSDQYVAVKVQKPYIRGQFPWDMGCYKLVAFGFEKLFDLPIYWTVDYTEKNLYKEVDFLSEGRNTERASLDLAHRRDVYVPKVYWDATSPRILTTEFMDGVKISDADSIHKMKLSIPEVTNSMIEIFSHQIFVSGFVHCDPHPGNILVRKNPSHTGSIFDRTPKHQLILLDHGLYIEESPKFRLQYCELWKAMFLLDLNKMEEICKDWGIIDSKLFASMQLMKPFNPSKGAIHVVRVTREDAIKLQNEAKEKLREFLQSNERIPRELIFIGRNMNLVRSNNKEFGSPVNRVNVMATFAASGLSHTPGSSPRWTSWEVVSFQSKLIIMAAFYYMTQLWKQANTAFGRKVGGFEEILEGSFNDTLEQFGFRYEADDRM